MIDWPAENSVLGLVCTLAEPDRSGRLFVMLRAFVDDSRDKKGTVFALGGFVAPARSWAELQVEWDKVLRMSPRINYFKYSEADNLVGEFLGISAPMRDEKAGLLWQVIEDHVVLEISCIVMLGDLTKSIERHSVPKGPMRNPYYHAFGEIVAGVARHQKNFGLNDRINFTFDDQVGEKGRIYDGWEAFVKASPEDIKPYVGDIPQFLNDLDHKGLQAADYMAGIQRQWMAHKVSGEQYPLRMLHRPTKPMPGVSFRLDHWHFDQIFGQPAR